MTCSQTGKRAVHLGCVAAVVTALAVGVAAPQPGRSLVRVENQPVLLEASVVSDVANISPAAATTPPASGSTAADAVAAATDDPAAIPRTIAQIVFTALGIALSPLWYLGFPITLPLTALQVAESLSVWGGLGYYAGLVWSPVVWLSFPLVAGSALALVLFPPPTSTVTPPVATARSVARPAGGMTETSPAANPPRRTQTSRDFGSRQASPNPAAAKSKRSTAHAAASRSSAKSTALRAAPARSSGGKADRTGKSQKANKLRLVPLYCE